VPAPGIATLEPPAGATDVDPATAQLRVTFDRPMQEGWSWVTEGSSFPPSAGAATMSADRRQAVLPVRLEPGRSYVVWLNSETYQGFRDELGTPLTPFRWTFTTRGGP
jgi:RNA polymerase sigma-70 factor (ECF subfamily)